jgi:hypothetical protein
MTTTERYASRRDKFDAATRQLIERTEAGNLRWTPNLEFCRKRGDDTEFVGPAYIAELGGKRIAVYEYRYKNFVDADEWFWDTRVGIDFIDESLNTEWTWPSPNGRLILLDVIRYRTSNADEFLNQILSESPAG